MCELRSLIKKKEALPQAGRYVTKSSLWLENKINYHPLSIAYGMFLTYFNGAYFSKLAIENNIVHRIKHQTLLESGTQ